MISTVSKSVVPTFKAFVSSQNAEPLANTSHLEDDLNSLFSTEEFNNLIITLIESPAFSEDLGKELAAAGAIAAISRLSQS